MDGWMDERMKASTEEGVLRVNRSPGRCEECWDVAVCAFQSLRLE